MPTLNYPRKFLLPALACVSSLAVAAAGTDHRRSSPTAIDTTGAPPSSAWLSQLPDGPEKRQFIIDCTGCHQFDVVRTLPGGHARTEAEPPREPTPPPAPDAAWEHVWDRHDAGPGYVRALLEGVMAIFEDFRYERVIGAPDAVDHALVFTTRVGDRRLEGCDFLHENGDGLIDEFVVMVRPLSGALALADAMRAHFEGAVPAP